MQVTISNEIFITSPTPEIVSWARENLVIPNPEYSKKQRMGLWTGNTEKQLYLYYVDGVTLRGREGDKATYIRCGYKTGCG